MASTTRPTQHVVMWSGGITSWAVAHLVAQRHGTKNLTLLFADTRYEDEDLYRWNDEASAQIGVPLTVVADGRDPWQVFNDKRYIGNTRIAPCSLLLKQIPCRTWLQENTDPANTIVYVGIDWTETHRIPAIVRNYQPWTAQAPLTEKGFRRDKDEWMAEAQELGLVPPRLYALGWEHNNCGGRCIKGGQAQWAHLLKVFPGRYAEVEAQEEALRQNLGTDVAFLRDRRGGETKPLPLRLLRTRLEADAELQPGLFDVDDWGGCGCLPDLEVPETA